MTRRRAGWRCSPGWWDWRSWWCWSERVGAAGHLADRAGGAAGPRWALLADGVRRHRGLGHALAAAAAARAAAQRGGRRGQPNGGGRHERDLAAPERRGRQPPALDRPPSLAARRGGAGRSSACCSPWPAGSRSRSGPWRPPPAAAAAGAVRPGWRWARRWSSPCCRWSGCGSRPAGRR